MAGPQGSFLEFVAMAVPLAIAFLVSMQVGAFVTTLQSAVISPVIGIGLLNGTSTFASLKYKYNDNITIAYGAVINAFLSTLTTLLLAYGVVRIAQRGGINATARLY
jgi:large-conductance mechanosensitive channel